MFMVEFYVLMNVFFSRECIADNQSIERHLKSEWYLQGNSEFLFY